MNREEAASRLEKNGGSKLDRGSALTGAQQEDGRVSGLSRGSRQQQPPDTERTRRAKEKLLEQLTYVDPNRSNSCNSLREAGGAIEYLMEKVDHALMEKKVDRLRVPASTYTTVKTAQMVSCYKVTSPDARGDDAAEVLGAGDSEEPLPAGNDCYA